MISIHSLVRGRTEYKQAYKETKDISIHSLVRGRTEIMAIKDGAARHFNPLPRERENSGLA